MSATPSKTAQNVWTTQQGEDFLQLMTAGMPNPVAWIDSGGSIRSLISGVVYVDGVTYPRTDVGINAAIAAAQAQAQGSLTGMGEVVIGPGHYICTNTITYGGDPNAGLGGVKLRFVGFPVFDFTLPGSIPAFQINVSGPGASSWNALTGSVLINMHSQGGTVFNINGGSSFTFGPTEGYIHVLNAAGDIIHIGPGSNTYSTINFRVGNIVADSVPGNFISLIGNDFSGTPLAAPYIENGVVENCSANLVTGRVLLLNVNATGPNVNFNALVFRNIQGSLAEGNNSAPVHIQSSLSAINFGSINFRIVDSLFVLPATNPAVLVDVDSATTAGNISGIVLESVVVQGGAAGATTYFSSALLSSVLSTCSLRATGFGGVDSFYSRLTLLSKLGISANGAAPVDALVVDATGLGSGITMISPGTDEIRLTSTNANAGQRNWGIGSSGHTQFGDFDLFQSNAKGGDPFNAGTSYLHIDNNGQVGIGQTSPGAKLDVNGTLSTAGLLIKYNSLTTAGLGLPPILVYSSTTPTTPVSATNILALAPAGLYRVTWYYVVTTTGTGGTSFTLNLLYTDAKQAQTIAAMVSLGIVAGTVGQGSFIVQNQATNNIQYSITETGAFVTHPILALFISMERLN